MTKFSVYSLLSRIKPLSGSYALKFLFIAFLGIHIPLLGVIAVLLAGKPSALIIFLTTFACTLAACAGTLYIQRMLLEPINRSFLALKDYLYKRELPHLPTQFPDEAGRLMRKIQLTLQQLDSLLKEKQDLAALLSHDVRAPLTNMIGLAGLIQVEDEPDAVVMMAQQIAAQASRQLGFVEDILTKMRLTDRYEQTLTLANVNLRTLIEEASLELSSQLLDKQLAVINEISPDLVLYIDGAQIRHVLQNLLTNAIKFSEKKNRIRFTTGRTAKQVLLHVHDNGTGFTELQAENLFKPYAAGQTGTAGEASTGIGLYLSRKIMELHGGTILAESSGPGQGTVFTLVFPSL